MMGKNKSIKPISIPITPELKALIQAAVDAGKNSEKFRDSPYKAIEKRLYGLPILKQRINDLTEAIEQYKEYGIPEKSNSVPIRFSGGGQRVSPEEKLEALIAYKEADIAADQYEVDSMEKALSSIEKDSYFRSISGKYFDNMNDDEIALEINCEKTTVWRNRSRLVQHLAVRLYGSQAL